MIHSNGIFEMLSIIKVRIKYYKVIRKICKTCWGHPQWFRVTSRDFEMFTPLNPLKLYFGMFFALIQKSDWSKYQLIEVACSSVKKSVVHYI